MRKKNEMARPIVTARVMMLDRSTAGRPFASATKIGTMPNGSTTTRSVVKAVSPNLSRVSFMRRLRTRDRQFHGERRALLDTGAARAERAAMRIHGRPRNGQA